jgi:hypothetical protein
MVNQINKFIGKKQIKSVKNKHNEFGIPSNQLPYSLVNDNIALQFRITNPELFVLCIKCNKKGKKKYRFFGSYYIMSFFFASLVKPSMVRFTPSIVLLGIFVA